MNKKDIITVQGTEVTLFSKEKEDYISLTDIAKYRDVENPSQIISLWLRTYSTIEYLGLWEKLNNPNFKPHIYEGFKNESAKPHFWMSAQKWINETNAIGMVSNGTCSAPFPKINYRIHPDAIKEQIIPAVITKEQASFIYANEADLLNVALFGKRQHNGAAKIPTAKEIFAILLHWNSWLSCRIWKVSMRCLFDRDFRKASDCCNLTALPLRKCGRCWITKI